MSCCCCTCTGCAFAPLRALRTLGGPTRSQPPWYVSIESLLTTQSDVLRPSPLLLCPLPQALQDLTNVLRLRAEEVVPGGMLQVRGGVRCAGRATAGGMLS